MKILSAAQIKQLDLFTIQTEAISSIDLMERASQAFVDWFCEQFSEGKQPILIFCGPGNNGGDGLAIARLLDQRSYHVQLVICQISKQRSSDFEENFKRLHKRTRVPVIELQSGDQWPALERAAILIDAIFGSGLNRPVKGYWGELLEYLNQSSALRVAVDIPSGLFADRHSEGPCFQADFTLSFQLPKLAFLFPENAQWLGDWSIRPIGLQQAFIDQAPCHQALVTEAFIRPFLKSREKFGHKGSYGHALLVVGSYGKTGAAILAARACLRAGAGLVTVHAPASSYPILQVAIPEAMSSIDPHEQSVSVLPDLKPYRSIGIGCGLGTAKATQEAFRQFLNSSPPPSVFDADALNILAIDQDLLTAIPKGSILTPHPGEFKRLFGASENDFERHEKQRSWAMKLGCYILLKGAHSCIACPDGHCYFNSTGNPGMATAGSGDVLTGILTALLAQGYSAYEAVLLGVYLHGLAGDIAAQQHSQQSLLASDLIDSLGTAFKELSSKPSSSLLQKPS